MRGVHGDPRNLFTCGSHDQQSFGYSRSLAEAAVSVVFGLGLVSSLSELIPTVS